MKYKILLKISLFSGLIPFVGGWLIFLGWLAGRYFYAIDFYILESIGLAWVLICFWVAIIGLMLLLVYTIINRKQLHLGVLYVACCILINIPSVFFIAKWQAIVERKVFVRFVNHSGAKNINLKLEGKYECWSFGKIDEDESMVVHYEPVYWNHDGRLYKKPDTLTLFLYNNKYTNSTAFPNYKLGECKNILINQDLSIEEVR